MGHGVGGWQGERGGDDERERGQAVGGQQHCRVSLPLVQAVDGLVTVSGQGARVSAGGVRSVEVGVVAVRGVEVQGVGFRLSQAERGYGENYDLRTKVSKSMQWLNRQK